MKNETHPQKLSLPHLLRPAAQSEHKPPLLLLVHGYGSNEQDLFGLAPYLDPRFLVASVRAPYTLMSGSYAWFELGFVGGGMQLNMPQAENSRDLLLRFVGEAVAAYEADPAAVYMLGFSQGAIMSAAVLLAEPETLAGAVLMSGSMVPDSAAHAEPERLHGKPVLVTHGTDDTVLPVEHGRHSRDVLQTLPVDLTYREYPIGHEVSPESLADVVAWLAERLDAGSSQL